MASYGTEEQLEEFLGEDLAVALATFAGDGTDDPTPSEVIAKARTDADGEIDAALARRYAVPFVDIADSPATPQIIQTISDNLTAANLFKKRHAAGVDYETYREEAEQLLGRIQRGIYDVPGAAEADSGDALAGIVTVHTDFSTETIEPTFAGRDSDGDDRMKLW